LTVVPMMSKSVVMIAPGELFGGVERHVLGLCRHLVDAGHEPKLLLFHDRELAEQSRADGIPTLILRERFRFDPAVASQIRRISGDCRADVLHLHGYRATTTALLAGGRGYPVIKTEHGLPEPITTSMLTACKSGSYHRLDRWSTRRLQAHVCYVTADIMHRFDRAHAGLPRRVIHNGIAPLDRAGRPRPAGLEPGLFHAGIVGRVSEVKGIVHALRALTSPEVPAHVRLDVIGTGPLLDALRHEAGVLGVADRVRFHGFQRDILDWIAHLDALLMPSLHEGLPYTLLEAMSLGVPAIASRVGGLAEVLRDGETGLLVEVGDAAGLAAALTKLAGDPRIGREMGEAAAREQRARYTLDRMVDDYLAVYAAAAAAR